jgi:hypothetical protein
VQLPHEGLDQGVTACGVAADGAGIRARARRQGIRAGFLPGPISTIPSNWSRCGNQTPRGGHHTPRRARPSVRPLVEEYENCDEVARTT